MVFPYDFESFSLVFPYKSIDVKPGFPGSINPQLKSFDAMAAMAARDSHGGVHASRHASRHATKTHGTDLFTGFVRRCVNGSVQLRGCPGVEKSGRTCISFSSVVQGVLPFLRELSIS